jgi:hypothetical protein
LKARGEVKYVFASGRRGEGESGGRSSRVFFSGGEWRGNIIFIGDDEN